MSHNQTPQELRSSKEVPDEVVEKAWLDRHGYTHVLELGLFEEFRNGFLAGMKYRDEQTSVRDIVSKILDLGYKMDEPEIRLIALNDIRRHIDHEELDKMKEELEGIIYED